MPKPSYICIGAQKAGTTALGELLNQHSEIHCLGEPDFFDKNYSTSRTAAYERAFAIDKPIVGEKSPTYCIVPAALRRIRGYRADMKLIFMVREPVARLWSQYKMRCRMKGWGIGEERLRGLLSEQDIHLRDMAAVSAIQGVELGRRAFSLRSRYGELLQNVYSLFPRNQVLVVVYEELIADPLKEGNRIAAFLGATQPFPDGIKLPKANVGGYRDAPSKALAQTARMRLRDDTELFYRLIGRRIPAWDTVHAAIV
jgi:hypothetical protein